MDCTCILNKEDCECKDKNEKFLDAWIESLENMEQPTCNIENQEDCENCGS